MILQNSRNCLSKYFQSGSTAQIESAYLPLLFLPDVPSKIVSSKVLSMLMALETTQALNIITGIVVAYHCLSPGVPTSYQVVYAPWSKLEPFALRSALRYYLGYNTLLSGWVACSLLLEAVAAFLVAIHSCLSLDRPCSSIVCNSAYHVKQNEWPYTISNHSCLSLLFSSGLC